MQIDKNADCSYGIHLKRRRPPTAFPTKMRIFLINHNIFAYTSVLLKKGFYLLFSIGFFTAL